ncbi:MAG: hypothetical protein AAFO78_09255, partial [Pseudomonadota bacterium]
MARLFARLTRPLAFHRRRLSKGLFILRIIGKDFEGFFKLAIAELRVFLFRLLAQERLHRQRRITGNLIAFGNSSP